MDWWGWVGEFVLEHKKQRVKYQKCTCTLISIAVRVQEENQLWDV